MVSARKGVRFALGKVGKVVKKAPKNMKLGVASGAAVGATVGIGGLAMDGLSFIEEEALGDRGAVRFIMAENIKNAFGVSNNATLDELGFERSMPHVSERDSSKYAVRPPDGSMVFGLYNRRLGG